MTFGPVFFCACLLYFLINHCVLITLPYSSQDLGCKHAIAIISSPFLTFKLQSAKLT